MPLPEAPVKEDASSSPSRRGAAHPIHWVTLLLLFASSVALRLECLACKPFWSDECFSVEIAWLDWRNFLHLMWWREANMSLYYVLLGIWLRAGQNLGQHLGRHFGTGEFFIRSLSVLMATATLPAIYWLARMLYDRRVALIAATLFTFSAYNVRYSQEARSYALFMLLATLSSGFLIAWLRKPSPRNRMGYILVSILAVYAHFYALLLVAVHWLIFRWLGSPRNGRDEPSAARTAHMRRAWITIGIAVSPLLIFIVKTGAGPIRWVPRPGLRDLLEFSERLSGGTNWVLAAIYAIACIAAIAPARKHMVARDQNWETWRCQFLVLWLFFPVVADGFAFLRPSRLSGSLHDLLPARPAHTGCCGAGANSAIVAAGGDSQRDFTSIIAGNPLWL